MPEFKRKEKADRRDILIEVMRKIMEKCSMEFKGGGTKFIDHGNWTEQVPIPDSRKEYCQLIEFFSDFLAPEFNEETKQRYTEITEELTILLKDYENDKVDQEKYIIYKTRLMRKLFQQINFLLKKTNYLTKPATTG